MHQDLERRQHRHKKRGALLSAQLFQRVTESFGKRLPQTLAGINLLRWPRTIGREREILRSAGQLFLPPRNRFPFGVAWINSSLPVGKITIAHWQLCQWLRAPLAAWPSL